ncbi:MAG: hypothetical protein Q9182_005042 [Xanthomendoza sp. 2 TL-2023]
MVATRSQDQELAMPMKALKESRNTDPDSGNRKRVNELKNTISTESRAKKARLGEDTTTTLSAVVIPPAKHYEATVPDSRSLEDTLVHNGTVKLGDLPLRGGKEQLHLSQGGHHVIAGAVNGVRSDDPNVGSSRPTTHGQSSRPIQSAEYHERKIKSPKKRNSLVNGASLTTMSPHDTLPRSIDNTMKSRHRRFETDETDFIPPMSHPDPSPPKEFHMKGPVRDTEADSSADEAPETLSAASAQQKAQLAAADAIKAAGSQRAIEKQKRRDRDRLLKSQAKPPKQAERADFGDDDLEMSLGDENTVRRSPFLATRGQRNRSSKDSLPALLPDEILAAEPTVRPPTPPPPQREMPKARVNTKRRFLDKSSKPPKDIQKGNLRIRVLEDRKKILPPKISKSSRKIRESWLAGRLGHKSRVVMERRQMGSGFVRR